jgi:ferritin-like metal-binding protein YciE
VFDMHGVERGGVDCPAIDGIIKEANEVAGEIEDNNVLDAALIAAAQAVEHYEMSPLRLLDRLGQAIGTERLRQPSPADSRRREGG